MESMNLAGENTGTESNVSTTKIVKKGAMKMMRTPDRQRQSQTIFCIIASTLLAAMIIGSVDAKLSIEPNPNQEVGMMNGESRYFICKTNSKSDQLAWIDPKGREVLDDPNNAVYVNPKRNSLKLELKSPTKQDSGMYKCVVRKGNSRDEISFKLRVFNPTKIEGKTNYQAAEGDRVKMDCSVTADREANVEFNWMFGNFDLTKDPKSYRISPNRVERISADEVRITSSVEISRIAREHDGKYVCEVDTSNELLSDQKELNVHVRVHYRPRFDEKTPRYIWISEETSQPFPTVNISCIVLADPVATISWMHPKSNAQIVTTKKIPGAYPQITISNNENMSTLSVVFRTIDEIKRKKIEYMCKAENVRGESRHVFEVKVGRIPDPPQIVSVDYKDGGVVLAINETHVEPAIDVYRLEIAEKAHLFNRSSNVPHGASRNSTYIINLPLPRGEHSVNVFAHNPVGWSETAQSSYFLTVISGAASRQLSTAGAILATTMAAAISIMAPFYMRH